MTTSSNSPTPLEENKKIDFRDIFDKNSPVTHKRMGNFLSRADAP